MHQKICPDPEMASMKILIYLDWAFAAYAELDVQVVVSKFNENLDWLNRAPFSGYPVKVYNKGPNEGARNGLRACTTRVLPNVGRESHTYLHHIIENYDSLANITVFLPGSADQMKPYHKWTRTKALMRDLEQSPGTIIPIWTIGPGVLVELGGWSTTEYNATDPNNQLLNSERSFLIPLSRQTLWNLVSQELP